MSGQTSVRDATPGYHGSGGALFWLMLRTTIYNLLTLGLYRFWQRTKMRQHFWNGIRIAGSPMEYTGTGLEKFLGFLIAVVFLAVYLGLFQLGFFFIGLQLSGGSELVGLFSSLPVLPLIYYAQYRARRYVLSRTQLRGIRFAMRADAFAYTRKALAHLLLTVLTLGVLYPRMQWYLEKFRTDRTTYGDLRLLQGGRWQALMRPWSWVIASLAVPSTAVGVFSYLENPIGAGVSVLGYLLFPLAWINYGVAAFRILTAGKSAGSVSFTSRAKTGTIFAIYVLGYLLIFVIGSVLITTLVTASAVATGETMDTIVSIEDLTAMMAYVTFWVLALGYVAIFLMSAALYAVFISQPVLSHFATTLVLHNADELDRVRQREQDDFVEAEGFADALDVGGAF